MKGRRRNSAKSPDPNAGPVKKSGPKRGKQNPTRAGQVFGNYTKRGRKTPK